MDLGRMVLSWIPLLMVMVVAQTPNDSDVLDEIDRLLTKLVDSNSDEQTVNKKALYKPCLGGFSCPRYKRFCLSLSKKCDGYTDCPDGFDESHCPTDDSRPEKSAQVVISKDKRGMYDQCADGYVACGGSGSRCIKKRYLCDGFVDCAPDGWDEKSENCGQVECPRNMMKCNGTGRCISRHDMCNDLDNCGDLEDESTANCGRKRCGRGKTMCPNANLCVAHEFWCDGSKDCPNGEDETPRLCNRIPCDGVRCSDGRCIHTDRYCDGLPDCNDGQDEAIEKCGPVRCPIYTEQCGSANYCYIEPRWRTCDGHPDCPNKADELPSNCQQAEVESMDWHNHESPLRSTSGTALKGLLEKILRQIPDPIS